MAFSFRDLLFSIQHRSGKLHCNADSLSRRPSSYCKRWDCPDCHLGDCVDSGGRTGEPKQLDSILLSSAKVAPVRTEQWFDSTESGSCNPVDDNDDSCSLLPNWLDTWSVDQLRTWQQEDHAIRQIN